MFTVSYSNPFLAEAEDIPATDVDEAATKFASIRTPEYLEKYGDGWYYKGYKLTIIQR